MGGEMDCDICLDKLKLAYSFDCGHSICISCTIKHLETHDTCHLCQNKIKLISPNFALRRLLNDDNVMTDNENVAIDKIMATFNKDKQLHCSNRVRSMNQQSQQTQRANSTPPISIGYGRDRGWEMNNSCHAPYNTPSCSPPSKSVHDYNHKYHNRDGHFTGKGKGKGNCNCNCNDHGCDPLFSSSFSSNRNRTGSVSYRPTSSCMDRSNKSNRSNKCGGSNRNVKYRCPYISDDSSCED